MLMRGVPREGKRVELTKGLSVQLPYGAAYGKNEDGDWVILQFSQPLPKNYKESLFSVDDEAEYRWRLNGFAQKSVADFPFTVEEMADSEEEWHQKLEQLLNDLAMQLTQQTETEEKEQGKHQEPETQVEEDENGNTTFRTTIHLNLQTKLTGQNYQIIPLKGARSALLFKNLVQVGGWMTLTFINLNFMIMQGKKLGWYTAGVSVPGEEDGFERCIKVLTPILQSMEMAEDVQVTENGVREEEGTKPAQPEKKPEQPKTPAPKRSVKKKQAVKPLYDQNGRLDAFVALKLIEDGALPIRFEDMAWEDGRCRLQSGDLCPDKAGVYQKDLDFDGSHDVVSALHELVSFLENDKLLQISSDAQTKEMREHLQGKDLTGLVWLYLASSHLFHIEEEENTYDIWPSPSFEQAVGDSQIRVLSKMKLLVRSLRAFNNRTGGFTLRYWERKEASGQKEAQGRPKAVVPALPKEGKMALTTFVELLSTDKIDYCDSRIGWDGAHYDVDNVTLAADNDIPNSQEIVQAFMEAFKTLEQDESLRIPSDKVSPQLRNFLGDHVSHGFTMRVSIGSGDEPDVQASGQFGGQAAGSRKMVAVQDMTGSVLLHMVLWEKLILQEPEKDHFIAYVDQGLAQGIPEWETYIRRLIAALRAIDGAEGEFALECRIFSDWGGPYALPILPEKTGDETCRTISCQDMESSERTALRGYNATAQEQMETVPFDDGADVSISGKTFVLTGDFAHDENDRDRVSWRITTKGGRVTTAVSGKTNYLVIGKLGNFGQKKVEQVKEQKAKRSDIKIIREDDLFRVLEGKPAASGKKASGEKPAASAKKAGGVKPEPAKTASAKADASQGKTAAPGKKGGTKKPNDPETDPNEAKKERIEKKRKEAVEQYLKQVTADFKKKKQELQKEIDSLSSEKEQHQQELNSAGFFQFSRKSSLKQIIRGIDIQYAKKQSELEELKKQEEDAKKEPYFKIDRKIREELAKETEKIVYANLCKLSEKDQQLGSLIVSMLSMDPVTFPEILERAKLLEIDATSLRVANIMRKLGVCSGAVTKRLYLRGVFYEPKEYTGYYL